MKRYSIFITIITVILGISLLLRNEELNFTKSQLELHDAIAETGPCGTEFSVPVENGKEMVVAGIKVEPEDVKMYTERQNPDHPEQTQIVLKSIDGDKVIFSRIQKQ